MSSRSEKFDKQPLLTVVFSPAPLLPCSPASPPIPLTQNAALELRLEFDRRRKAYLKYCGRGF